MVENPFKCMFLKAVALSRDGYDDPKPEDNWPLECGTGIPRLSREVLVIGVLLFEEL